MMLDESHLQEGMERQVYNLLHFLLRHGFLGDYSDDPILRPDTNHMVRWAKEYCALHANTVYPEKYLR